MTEGQIEGDLHARLQRLLGRAIERCVPVVGGGYTPTDRWIVYSGTDSFFAKVATTPLTAVMLQRELHAYQNVQAPFMPAYIAGEDDESAPILLTEDLSGYRWPPPWKRGDVDKVLTQIEAMHGYAADVPTSAEIRGSEDGGWAMVAADPHPFLSLGMAAEAWLERALPDLLEAEADCSTVGSALCHWDIRSDNLCLSDAGAVLVDWAEACLSNPQLDLGFWLPSLASEGGPLPEDILPDAPAVAAWVCGYFAARAGLPQIPDAPRVRWVQRRQFETALPWAARAVGLPLPS